MPLNERECQLAFYFDYYYFVICCVHALVILNSMELLNQSALTMYVCEWYFMGKKRVFVCECSWYESVLSPLMMTQTSTEKQRDNLLGCNLIFIHRDADTAHTQT